MDKIEIRNLQNLAKNMFVGSKQHALFQPVIGNNPPLVNGDSNFAPIQGQDLHAQVDISKIDVNGQSITAISITQNPANTDQAPSQEPDGVQDQNLGNSEMGGMSRCGLNSHLHGMLSVCPKQYYYE